MIERIKKHGLLFFFCAIMGGIIMFDCVFAVDYTYAQRGIANQMSKHTITFSVLQPESESSFLQEELNTFLQGYSGATPLYLVKNILSQSGVELYSSQKSYFLEKENSEYGVYLRSDTMGNYNNGQQFYYKDDSYVILGSYEEPNNRYVLDMRGDLEGNPKDAVNGTYYLDAGLESFQVYNQLQQAIVQKYPMAQVLIDEASNEGQLLHRILTKSGDAMYYMMQMGLIVLLNLLNFGNIAAYWVHAKETEIYVRRLHGGTFRQVVTKLAIPFVAMTAAFILVGMAVGTLIVGLRVDLSVEGILLGVLMCFVQWILLALFELVVLCACVRTPLMKLRKGR